jgi:DNA topoisomerase I
MSTRLVIVESPTKAKTIEKYLGSGFTVTSSYGHVRDLPNSAAEIPEKVKKEPWSRLGVNVESEFEPLYIVPDSKKKRVKELKDLLKDASELYLATDEDREGESISWHLLEVLKPKVPVKRLVFNEITKEAIKGSLEKAREVDMDLVRAQEARRVIDRLYGYSVSPLLWKKVKPRLSAGRVQSVATRLLVERERSRIGFMSAEYWDLKAEFSKSDGTAFTAELTTIQGKRVASGKDFDENTGKLSDANKSVILLNKQAAEELKAKLLLEMAQVVSVETKPYTSKPAPPFTTSTLQQEGNRKLSFSARRTMSVAQTLYENGFITYMRTDSTNLSNEGLEAARNLIAKEFGREYLSQDVRSYKTKVKNAQEAHEAIRPAGIEFVHPDVVKAKFGIEAGKLYEMIWKRTLACQMKDAEGERIVAKVSCQDAEFRASGKTISFPGYLRAYVEGSDDPEADLADQEKVLPPLKEKEPLAFASLAALQHQTKAPARYTEGSLIKELENLGIGRPSTWATIVDVVLSRGYAFKKGTALVPTFLAMILTRLMEQSFSHLVDYGFTAQMEDDLDSISRGEAEMLSYLKGFYFGGDNQGLKTLVEHGEQTIDPRIVNGMAIGTSPGGKEIEVRVGKYGAFITDNQEVRASVPEFLAPDDLTIDKASQLLEEAERGPQPLGLDPATGKPVYAKSGRYGPYLQLGDPGETEEDKPKMVSLLDGMQLSEVTLETALQLLSLPRLLGKHPHTGDDIVAANGRYGQYISCDKDTRSLPGDADYNVLSVTLEDALELLKQPKTRGRRAPAKPLKEVGVHPHTEKPIIIKSGAFGPYVTDGELNASLPKGMDIMSITLEDAVNLLGQRAIKLAEQADEDATAPKKAAAKKSSSKKKAAK